ncbi:MAG: nuclease [Capsulimonas sp.]|uniref:nuclease n=1 Tax=Capsulimonas sp. TaxID=2494211 RepID=UPI00326530C6
MPRLIVLDTFPLSSVAKREPMHGAAPTLLDRCQEWVKECIRAGNRVIAPAITYYETLRELERLNATSQIARLRAFCIATPERYLPLQDADLNLAAKLWAQSRNNGLPTSSPEALDGDVILVAQVLSIQTDLEIVIATTNVGHLSQFVAAELWSDIAP